MTARPTPPSTKAQVHPREDLHRFVNQLNVRYNVGIPIPEPSLTVAEKREDQSQASRIYRRLEVHFYTGGTQALKGFLRQFDVRAKDYWSNWVHKPKADADTLPSTQNPPLAANLTERDWLQTIFNEVLDTAQPNISMQPSTSRSFGRSQSGPAAVGGDASPANTRTPSRAPSRPTPKRRADAELGDSLKKTRSDPDPIRDLTAASSLRRRQALGANASASASASSAMGPPRTTPVGSSRIFRSFATATSGISAASAVFSEAGNVPDGTQDTNVASSEEQFRPPLGCSQDSYGVSSSLEASLHRTFDHGHPQMPDGPQMTKSTRSSNDGTFISTQTSEIMSSMPPDVAQEVLQRVSDVEAAHNHALSHIWPSFPSWLRSAPFPIIWEVVRIGHSCGVDLPSIELSYSPQWENQTLLRQDLWKHPAFQGKPFPAASSDAAWTAGLVQAGLQEGSDHLNRNQQVVYSASIDFSSRKETPLQLTFQPLKIELPHRLARHYGADRFFELLIPSPDSSDLPAGLKNDASTFFDRVISWMQQRHVVCGRQWAAFYNKSGGSRKPVKTMQLGKQPKPVYLERIFFFAESSVAGTEPGMSLKRVSRTSMLRWALSLDQKDNGKQPFLKLYQRIALPLSRTSPAMVFEKHQIVNLKQDLLSPAGEKVMNDGVGRMSLKVAKQIRDSLGLTFTPSAVQGRLGSAKGMWIVDTTLPSDEISIETYPSQRKWVLDWQTADEDQRTLEIRNFSSLPKSASFNLQFLPVLEDRAIDKRAMWEATGNLLTTNLQNELAGQKRALQTPMQFRQWVHENSSHKHDRIIHGCVPYQGGMPQEDEEVMNKMLDAGFEPKSNKYLSKMIYEMQKRKSEMLMKKLNITVGRSAYLYMVVDFSGVLEEDEVHVGFSTAFEADDDWNKTMIQGIDVLVARSPAHYNSDIQRVHAVFKPELADLTDVIVFSTKGDVPLADKLSGGDYDGDMAWVCWDPRIVDNFQNAPVLEPPDLSNFMPKDKTTFRRLVKEKGDNRTHGMDAMMAKCFAFNLAKSMLGSITNYKERLCYAQNSVSNESARLLSTVLSNLVDQPKQGIRFTTSDWQSLRSHHNLPANCDDPIYKRDHWPPGRKQPRHIIDYLKFSVAQPTVARELKSFAKALGDGTSDGPQHWDEDVAAYYKMHDRQADGLLPGLKEDIQTVHRLWKDGPSDGTFAEKVARAYPEWRKIQPRHPRQEEFLRGDGQILLFGGESSRWELLKASTAFWMFCNAGNAKRYGPDPRFVWQMACTQLCELKAIAVTNRNGAYGGGAVGAPRAVIPSMYAALRPDAKYVKMVTARMEGGSQFGLGGDDDDDDDDGGQMGMDD